MKTEETATQLPMRERKKLQAHLELCTGVKNLPTSPGQHRPPPFRSTPGVPLTAQYAMPFGKHVPTTAQSRRQHLLDISKHASEPHRGNNMSDNLSKSTSRDHNPRAPTMTPLSLFEKINRSLANDVSSSGSLDMLHSGSSNLSSTGDISRGHNFLQTGENSASYGSMDFDAAQYFYQPKHDRMSVNSSMRNSIVIGASDEVK